MENNVLALVLLGGALGLRHGIDWDHIAAIADITSTTVSSEEALAEEHHVVEHHQDDESHDGGHSAVEHHTAAHTEEHQGGVQLASPVVTSKWQEGKEGFVLATFYALGHATVVFILGLLALWVGAILPEWLDPLMERVVGVTLVLLGLWIFYSLWRYGRSFRLRSRWMLIFSWVRNGWAVLHSKMTGSPTAHAHDLTQYGPKTAYSIGMVHGIGAETGSQALLLASAAGASGTLRGSVLLLAFTIGLIMSNSIVAAFSAFSFVSTVTKRNVYVVIGFVAGVFSLLVGSLFLFGQGTALPDLQDVVNLIFGAPPA